MSNDPFDSFFNKKTNSCDNIFGSFSTSFTNTLNTPNTFHNHNHSTSHIPNNSSFSHFSRPHPCYTNNHPPQHTPFNHCPPSYHNPHCHNNMPGYSSVGYTPYPCPPQHRHNKGLFAALESTIESLFSFGKKCRIDSRSNSSNYGHNIPTLKYCYEALPSNDAKVIHDSINGFNRDSKMILNILTHRTSGQRENIKIEYKKLTVICLYQSIHMHFHDSIRHIIYSLLYTGAELDAYLLNNASSVFNKNNDVITNIICTRSTAQLNSINEYFQKMFRNTLYEHINRTTFGNYRKLLLHLIHNPRPYGGIDPRAASETASSLYDNSFVKISTPENWIYKLCNCSFEQLINILQNFRSIYGKNFSEYLKSYHVSDYEEALITLSKYFEDPIKYYASFLHKSLKKRSINGVSFIICTRCEIDLGNIVNTYQTIYRSNLQKDLNKEFGFFNNETTEPFEMLLGLK